MAISGSRLRGFREGWALKAFNVGKAHYFRRKDMGLVASLCGSQDAPAGWLYDAGSGERCERCVKLRGAEIAKAVPAARETGQDERGDHWMSDGKASD